MIRPSLETEARPVVELQTVVSSAQVEHIISFLEAGTWTCPTCGSIVHNWTKICPFNYNKNYCLTPREDR